MRKQSLTPSGAVAGFATGFLMVCTGWRGLVLFYFYQLGSWATKYKVAIKSKKDATLASHANRGAVQVLCVSLLACALSLWHALSQGAEKPIDFAQYPQASRIALAITAHHATGLADTLASELGILTTPFLQKLQRGPVLVTQPWKSVPPGTNGGVTIAGCFWSLIGGAAIGVLTLVMDAISGLHPASYAVPFLVYTSVSGLLGSLLDSIIGATCQATYYDPATHLVYHFSSPNRPETAHRITGANLLTNEQVNLVSTALAVALGGWVLAPMIFSQG